jgi:DNA helicase-2/ATP-dependent DNA helicase PcrA
VDHLEELNAAQREAITATTGPVAILAGAGTGKTRVIAHRVAHAVATGAVAANRALLVTFTEKAASEMVERVRRLGLPQVTARTFHAAALAQLRYFWPVRHAGAPLPDILSDPFRIVAPLARRLPGGYTWTPAKDLIDELSWARSRRISADTYAEHVGSRAPPIPVELFVRLYRDYERAKSRQGVIDFDDMLTLTVELLETDEEAARQVQGRYSWFSVDEFQDTNPLQYRLLELWLGERRDVCVVGDEDQTIYTFAGATPEYLNGFATRFPDARVIALTDNYRSTPQVLALANRLIASTGRSKSLTATRAAGPEPTVRAFDDGDAELDGIVARVRELMAGGTPAREIAVLVRLNAQIAPVEAAFTKAGIPYRVRGQRFFDRREVRAAVEALAPVPAGLSGAELMTAVLDVWAKRVGFEPDAEVTGAEARERQAALSTLLSIVDSIVAAHPSAGSEDLTAALADRAQAERSGGEDGVELATLHRAKGLEWDAVFLPSLEEGLLPVAQAKDDDALIDEERRLLYVGITRSRVHLMLSWAENRTSAQGRSSRRQRSRFVRDLMPAAPRRVLDGARVPRRERIPGEVADDPVMSALRAWRTERARADAMPPYVIAHDSTLAAIADRRPEKMTELARVPGIGPAKLEKYGTEILGVLAGVRTP